MRSLLKRLRALLPLLSPADATQPTRMATLRSAGRVMNQRSACGAFCCR